MPAIVISEERGVRYLHFGSPWVQGAMRISRPDALELEYTREMMLPLVLRERDWPASVLQIGLGSASITRFLHRHRPEARMTVLEISPEVIVAAQQFFGLPEESRRLRIEVGDGHEYVMTKKGRFDFIVVDGFDHKGRSGMLDTAAFYMNCRERLASRGMMAINLLSRSRGVDASVERMRQAFGERVLVLPPSDPGNTVALTAVGRPVAEPIEDLRKAAAVLKADTGLNLLPTLARLGTAEGEQVRL
jgi:spermidine synthase